MSARRATQRKRERAQKQSARLEKGCVSEDAWESCIQRVKLYCTANGEEEDKKVPALLDGC